MSLPSYSQLMAESNAYITIKLDLREPVEITDFARLFASLGKQFDDYITQEHPDVSGYAKFYVKEIRKGSIVADLIPQIKDIIGLMDGVLVLTGFATLIGWRIKQYISGKEIPGARKTDIEAISDMVKSVAHDSKGKASIESFIYQQGVWSRQLKVSFTTKEARTAMETLEEQKLKLEKTESADYSRVLMVFERSSTRDAKVGKRSGDRVIIETISPKSQALIYASELAEDQIRHEIRDADDNVFKKAFIVDVNVEYRQGRLIGYRITNLHQIIDLPDDNDD